MINEPSLNGRTLGLHEAASDLYDQLISWSWFVGVLIDEPGEKIVVEANDVKAAQERLPTCFWRGWKVVVQSGQALVRKG
jgi:hypothetical protein